MPSHSHTWLFEPGAWSAAGSFWYKGEVAHEGRGSSIVRHEGAVWEIEGSMEIRGETPLRFQNIYRLAAPAADARVIPWRSDNPAIGTLAGVFVVVGDTVMSSFRSGEGNIVGSEHLRQLAPDRYQARGLFLASGVVVSAWSMELVREA